MISEKTSFTISLGKMVAVVITIVGMAFTIGMSYQQIIPDREAAKKQSEEIADIKITLSRVTTILENMEKKTDNTSRDVGALQGRTQTMNTQLEVIASKLEEKNRKR